MVAQADAAGVVLSSVSLNLSVMDGAEIEMHDSEVQLRGMFTRTLCPSTLKEKELPACADALAISIAAIRTSFRMGASRTGGGLLEGPYANGGGADVTEVTLAKGAPEVTDSAAFADENCPIWLATSP